MIGNTIERHAILDSTNLRGKMLLREGAPDGMVILAEEQTAGRGRLSRTWSAKKGDALLMTVLLRPEGGVTGTLVHAVALGVCLAMRETGIKASIKWPNDIVFQGGKLCGMLLEMAGDGVAAGIGVNIHGCPGGDAPHALCLDAAAGRTIDKEAFLSCLLRHLDTQYVRWQRGEDILSDYAALSATLGQRVRAIAPDGEYVGLATGILPDGSLVIRDDDGQEHVFLCGDVSVRGIMGYV